MESVGLLIVGAIAASAICAKARVPGPAVLFALVAMGLFLATPVGAPLPGFLAGVVSAVDEATAPLLDEGGAGEGSEPVG